MSTTEPQGFWLDSGVRNVPVGELHWSGLPRKAYAASVNGSAVASVRRQLQGGWVARIDGWKWTVTPEMGAARLDVKDTPVKLFKTSSEARAAVEAAFVQLERDKEKFSSQSK
jgi:hypothetical protein